MGCKNQNWKHRPVINVTCLRCEALGNFFDYPMIAKWSNALCWSDVALGYTLYLSLVWCGALALGYTLYLALIGWEAWPTHIPNFFGRMWGLGLHTFSSLVWCGAKGGGKLTSSWGKESLSLSLWKHPARRVIWPLYKQMNHKKWTFVQHHPPADFQLDQLRNPFLQILNGKSLPQFVAFPVESLSTRLYILRTRATEYTFE
jgi:hypothetical protein